MILAQKPERRPLERALIRGNKVILFLLIGGAIWAVLTLSLFLCSGLEGCALADGRLNRLGPILTLGVVWPALGLLCLIGHVLVQGLPELVARVFSRLLIGADPPPASGDRDTLQSIRARVQSWDRR